VLYVREVISQDQGRIGRRADQIWKALGMLVLFRVVSVKVLRIKLYTFCAREKSVGQANLVQDLSRHKKIAYAVEQPLQGK